MNCHEILGQIMLMPSPCKVKILTELIDWLRRYYLFTVLNNYMKLQSFFFLNWRSKMKIVSRFYHLSDICDNISFFRAILM